MSRRITLTISIMLLLGMAGSSMAQIDPASVTSGHVYLFDSVAGTTVPDDSANTNDGTAVGGPQVVSGLGSQALQFDGVDDYVTIPDATTINTGGPHTNRTVIVVFRCDDVDKDGKQTLFEEGGRTRGAVIYVFDGEVYVGAWNRAEYNWNGEWLSAPIGSGEWHSVAFVIRNGTGAVEADKFEMWLDGRLVATAAGGQLNGHGDDNGIGATFQNTVFHDEDGNGGPRDFFGGAIDEIWILNDALTASEMLAWAGNWPYAAGPEPGDGALHLDTWVGLSWAAGAYAASHDVYLGTSFEDVNEAAEGTFLGNTTDTRMVVGVAGKPLPEGLVPGTTYYWRVDEVNDVNAASPWRGDVWSFLVPPKTAYEPLPGDGTPYVLPTTQLSWSPGLKAFMRSVYIGTDPNEVANATGGPIQVETTYDVADLELGTNYYWRVDEFDGMWNTGPVWSFTTVPEIAVEDPSLKLWWMLDEGTGSTAIDRSGHGSHGAIRGDAQWVIGYQGTALEFGQDVYVESLYAGITGSDPRTLCAWINTDVANTNMTIMSWGENVTGQKWRMRQDTTGGLRIEVNGGYHYGVTPIGDGNWHHVAVTFEDDGTPDVLDTLLYVDGVLDTTLASQATDVNTASTGFVRIGESPWHDAPWEGLIDDARVYDKVLTEEDLRQVMRGDLLAAWDLSPADGRTVDIRDLSALSWEAGDMADEHDVYLGFDRDAVFAADAADASGIYRGRQAGTTYAPADGFEWGQTYYWRVDEVNTDGTITEGGVRTFTVADFLPVEDFEAYDDIQDEGGNPVFLTWIDGFGDDGNGSVVGYIDPANGTFNETSNVHGGRQAMPFAYDNTTAARSEASREFSPAEDWTGYDVTDLSLWVHGQAAGFAELGDDGVSMSGGGSDIWNTADEFRFVYKTLSGDGSMTALVTGVGAGSNAWCKGGVMIRQDLQPGSINAMVAVTGGNGNGGTFQWRPTANDASASSNGGIAVAPPYWVRLVREGDTFTHYFSADGETWEQQATGSIDIPMTDPVLIGLAVTSHEATEIRGYSFDNISTTGNVTGAWQMEDVGIFAPLEGGNDPADLYVTVEDSAGGSATIEHPDPEVILTPAWQNWRIPLDSLAGVNLSRIDQMTLGVSGSGSTGMLLFDDIQVVRPEPVEDPNEAVMP